jgi:hypothetical protein
MACTVAYGASPKILNSHVELQVWAGTPGLRQEILDPETALALDEDDSGTLSKTGSIGGVTPTTI